MFRILYRFLASLARLAVRSGRSKALEIIVLRPLNNIINGLAHTIRSWNTLAPGPWPSQSALDSEVT